MEVPVKALLYIVFFQQRQNFRALVALVQRRIVEEAVNGLLDRKSVV